MTNALRDKTRQDKTMRGHGRRHYSASKSASPMSILQCRYLDLVISDGTVIENVNFLSPLGNSDHSVLLIDGSLKLDIKEGPERFNYNKGAYDNLRDSLSLDWEELLLPHCNDIDKMREAFKRELFERIHKFIPRVNDFSS